jgi:hypothetical protein
MGGRDYGQVNVTMSPGELERAERLVEGTGLKVAQLARVLLFEWMARREHPESVLPSVIPALPPPDASSPHRESVESSKPRRGDGGGGG